MKLSDYIKKHHKGVQSHFAAFHGIPASRVSELLKSDNTAFVFDYVSNEGERVTSIFKEGRRLKPRVSESTGKIEVTMDGLRKDLSSRAYELKESFVDFLADEDIARIDAEHVIENLNTLLCSINAIQCVSVEGIEGFSDQPDVHVELVDLDESSMKEYYDRIYESA